ncbi:MAG: response regulator [Magnetospirillum sp.]|nr:response regulator [Magnetospirillum sp.]
MTSTDGADAVLIVDDNPSTLISLEAALAPLNTTLVLAATGNEALKHLLQRQFAVVLLDVNLPDMDGFTVARLMYDLERTRGTPVIFLTAGNADEARGYQLGAVDYVTKPVSSFIIRSKVAVFVELARRTRRLIQLEEHVARVERLEALGRLTGRIAHDFNNMLGAIVGSLDSLSRLLTPGSREGQRAAVALEGALACSQLVKQLLTFARVQSGGTTLICLGAKLDAIGELIKRSAGPGVEVKILAPQDSWPVCVDPSQFNMAILNLTTNARDAMPEGGELAIAVENQQVAETMLPQGIQPGEYVVVTVSDTGQGMAPEVAKHAMEPFFTTKAEGKGTGLGLSSVHAFVAQAGGHAEMMSQQDVGTTVRLWFPRGRGSLAAHTPSPPDRDEKAHGETLLVVDDEPLVLTVAASTLRDLGYNVVEAGSGGEALDRLAEHGHIDLLFTDIVMPGGMNGWQLAAEAVRRHPDLKILYTSGFAPSIDRDEAVASLGRLLEKPYRHQQLAEAVRLSLETVPTP